MLNDAPADKARYLLCKVWRQMHRRCENPSDQRYARYGRRGITVDSCWDTFAPFYTWALDSGYSFGMSLDRKDNDAPYSPDNCRWSTAKEQANNTSRNHVLTVEGVSHTLAEWSELTGLDQSTLRKRVTLGWDAEKVISEPLRCNVITYQGVTKTLAAWSRDTGLAENTISRRLQRGWSLEDALTKRSQRSPK